MNAGSSYQQSIETWQKERLAKLKAEDGWLTVAGLFWLHEGDNAAGNDAKAVVQLPRGPAALGTFRFSGAGSSSFVPAGGIDGLALNGKPVGSMVAMQSDADGAKPDVLTYADFSFFVIK